MVQDDEVRRDAFLALSALLTDYDRLTLIGTGLVDDYLDVVHRAVGGDDAKLATLEAAASQSDPAAAQKVLTDGGLEPLAKQIVKLWFLGIWYEKELKDDEPGEHGRVVSGRGYVEALVWNDAAAHAQAAKQPGWATWSFEPLKGGTDRFGARRKGSGS